MCLPPLSLRASIFVFLACALFLVELHLLSPSSSAKLIEHAWHSQIQVGVHVQRHPLQDTSLKDTHNARSNPHLGPLLDCPVDVNTDIRHLRLPHTYLNISFSPPSKSFDRTLRLFNPSLLPLPAWSTSGTYLVVSRVVTEGLHQESLVCLADICLPADNATSLLPDTRICTQDDVDVLGATGGLRCTHDPIKLNVPPTPALLCEGAWSAFPDIPGFHDPRVFWSGKGEPLIILNSASQYGCIGLWLNDLRTLYPEFEKMVNHHGQYSGPPISYHHLTEITRNPRGSRASVEKNWMLWFPGDGRDAYVQYDLGPAPMPKASVTPDGFNATTLNQTSSIRAPGRTLAKLIGNGFTTPNLTSPIEASCFEESHNYDCQGNVGHWHQGSNSLKLILCSRSQARSGECGDAATWTEDGREVHISIIHRKFSNEMDLPMRYERYVAVWEGRRPFRMLGVSKHPILMQQEWARPWSADQNWPSGDKWTGNWTSHLRRRRDDKGAPKSSAYFTYSPSLAWAWRPRTEYPSSENTRWYELEDEDIRHLSQLGTGYLGDDVLVGIGLDDVEQALVSVKVNELVSCLRLCPGIRSV